MGKVDCIFVVLVYRNIDILEDFFRSLALPCKYKVIIVNSYYDEQSLKRCREVAEENGADFIPIDNRGFGYGNNVGVKYAMEHYEYDYLILSNSDIQVNSMDALFKLDREVAVIAPHTHLPGGKIQNPNIPWRMKSLFRWLKSAYGSDSRMKLWLVHCFTRTCRELFRFYRLFSRKPLYDIYSCHGSFIAFTGKAVDKLFPFFDDRMFLYNEELYLAENCRMKNVPVYYCPEIDVLHLEGASTVKGAGFKHNKESFDILYRWMSENGLI